jgi:hypothetical protein
MCIFIPRIKHHNTIRETLSDAIKRLVGESKSSFTFRNSYWYDKEREAFILHNMTVIHV